MANHRIKMRLTGLPEDLQRWIWLGEKLEERELVRIISQSKPYANTRIKSEEFRSYLELHLLLDAPDDELKSLG